eukprot:CAMPEP_0202005232 /NCGR_PEP_ID=MMETSP0905-20130828/10321_1 /ASSEMBLY_ACC=CAM_ASM_000554 /TAXON_ID=420261 /ORGANISM="Thalassiosira antarctica, Strain CCMP982" /LENGTH=277 /DNA_ID=CAMNT_0048562753 /DNA_START=408 /DNA_END=1241 /DNA_ORIENTATION=-
MAKSKKMQQGKKSSKRSTKIDPQKQLLAEANAQMDPLSHLPSAFLSVPLSPPHNGVVADDDGQTNSDNDTSTQNNMAFIQHFSSPLPPNILKQCLELFQMNMGDMYRQSSWGLNVEEKLNELQHDDARFLVVLSSASCAETTVATNEARNDDAATAEAVQSDNDTTNEKCMVLGFAHFRYELDDYDLPNLPITYLYELQIHPTVQKIGLGKKLMTMIELLSLQLRIKKVMLTVFHSNEAAMGFYRKNKYAVDECSPSQFSGEENENCDYEILSKSFG